MTNTKHRRRGKELDDAIFQAVRDIVNEEGYAALTFQKVAQNSQTSRDTLYRRYKSLIDMTVKAFRSNRPTDVTTKLIDTGSLQDDLRQYFSFFTKINNRETITLLSALITERMKQNDLFAYTQEIMEIAGESIKKIFNRALVRGEITELPSQVLLDMAIDYFRFQLIIGDFPIDEQRQEEVIKVLLANTK
jgi:AcrR family transcriptional regulator